MHAGPGLGPSLHTSHPIGSNLPFFQVLHFLGLYGGPWLSGGSKFSQFEDLDFFKLLRLIVVALSGSKSSNIEGLGFVKRLWRTAVACGGPKPSNIGGLDFLNLYGGPSLLAAGRNPQKQ